MSDIVARAKELVEHGFTPPPWGVVRHDFGYDSHFIAGPVELPIKSGEPNIVRECHANLIAAAPELAQALAEETWEYTQEIYFNGKWQPIYEDLWYDNPEECKSLFLDIEPWKYHDEPLRIVRRRVSPMEVINE